MKLIDIARLANVSKTTASRALADSPLVKEATKKRVKEIAEQYNYHPHTLARAMASQRSGILGFCLLNKQHPQFGTSFFGPVLDGALQQAQKDGYHLILAANTGNYSFEEAFIQDAIEGVILSSFDPANAIQVFQKRGIPQVVINDVLDADHTAFVIDDNYSGARAIMRHLIHDCGHRNIAIVTSRLSHTSYLLRYLAYRDALAEAGLSPYENDCFRNVDLYGGYDTFSNVIRREYGITDIPRVGTPVVVSSNRMEAGFEAVRQMIASGKLPSAIFAATDSLAVGVIKALQQAGLRIPQDVAVAGYDDVPEAVATTPALTTIRVDRNSIGQAAVRKLVQLIEHPDRKSETVYVPNKLIIRESTML